MTRILFVTFSLVLVTAPLAQAQGPVNPSLPQPVGPPPVVVVPATPPVITTPPPVVVAPSSPPAVMAPPTPAGPPSTVMVPEGSTITVFNQGVRQDYQKYSVQGNVQTFDSWSGRMTLQDGTVVMFPPNFAFTQIPESGQPVKLTYFRDANGNNIGTAIDNGTEARQ